MSDPAAGENKSASNDPDERQKLETVLSQELARLRDMQREGPAEPPSESGKLKGLRALMSGVRAAFNGERSGDSWAKEDESISDDLARRLFENKLTALCLSGGGIRSATFCLGILQALAQRGLLSQFDYLSTVSGGGYIGSWLSAWRSRCEKESAASGETRIAYVENRLANKRPRLRDPTLPDKDKDEPVDRYAHEPLEVTNLRDFTSYLTPRRGLMSSDTWAGIATIFRNLVLNWLLFLPLLLLLVWIPKFTVLVFEYGRIWLTPGDSGVLPSGSGCPASPFTGWTCALLAGILKLALLVFGWIAALFAWVPKVTVLVFEWAQNWLPPFDGSVSVELDSPASQLFGWAAALYALSELFTGRELAIQQQQGGPLRKPARPYGAGQVWYVILGLLPAYAAACLASIVLIGVPGAHGWDFMTQFAPQFAKAGALLWGLPFLGALLLQMLCNALPAKNSPVSPPMSPKDRAHYLTSGWRYAWLVFARFLSGAAFGVVAVLVVALLKQAGHDADRYVVVFGISGFFLAHLAASTLFAGLSTAVPDLDTVREWTARAGGWFLVSGLIWTVYAYLVLWDPQRDLPIGIYSHLGDWKGLVHLLVTLGGGLAGVASALFGRSASTAPTEGRNQGRDGFNWNRVAVAGAIFFSIILVLELSWAFDRIVLGGPLADMIKGGTLTSHWRCFVWAAAVFLVWAILASGFINVNKFSLHAYYRNRLIRSYLGASNFYRRPSAFTGFDEGDNPRMHELLKSQKLKDKDKRCQEKPIHIINIALNLVGGKDLAWQERKASSFTVSPLAAGNPHLGYCRAENYGDQISLGTAMAISGAAASPNMGYHSSPPLALLMTLFNVRLGWWLGNPAQRAWKLSGPRQAFLPFIFELFGLTDDQRRFVYLSDGGHFENLGIYEMLRRRCRTIVAVDAGADPNFEFADLGNAIRKARIDFGVEIEFSQLTSPNRKPACLGLINRPKTSASSPYCAIGRIQYPEIPDEAGTLIYIKAAIHGDEPEDILTYATASSAFPHESTIDQFFTESQFESYRQLGMHIGTTVFGRQRESSEHSDAYELAKIAAEHVQAHAGAAAT